MTRRRHNTARRKKKQSLKKSRPRSTVHAVHIERQGAGAGFHSPRKYVRRKKHKKVLPED